MGLSGILSFKTEENLEKCKKEMEKIDSEVILE